jgi:hypothetical protein
VLPGSGLAVTAASWELAAAVGLGWLGWLGWLPVLLMVTDVVRWQPLFAALYRVCVSGAVRHNHCISNVKCCLQVLHQQLALVAAA